MFNVSKSCVMCNLVTRVSHLPAPMERERRDSENEVAVYEEAMPRRARLGKKNCPYFSSLAHVICLNLSQSLFCFLSPCGDFFPTRENVYFDTFSTFSVLLYTGKFVSEYRDILVCERALRVVTEKRGKWKKRLFLSFSVHNFFPMNSLLQASEIYALLTKREVKMAGYWPVRFCVFMDRDGVEVHKHAEKKTRPMPSYFDLTLGQYGFRRNFSCRTRRVYSTQDLVHLACSQS